MVPMIRLRPSLVTIDVIVGGDNDPPFVEALLADVNVDEDASDTLVDLFAGFGDLEDTDGGPQLRGHRQHEPGTVQQRVDRPGRWHTDAGLRPRRQRQFHTHRASHRQRRTEREPNLRRQRRCDQR